MNIDALISEFGNSSDKKINPEEFNLLSSYIESISGLHTTEDKSYLIETRLQHLIKEANCEQFMDFYNLLQTAEGARYKQKVINAMTTNETLWMRDQYPFDIIKNCLMKTWIDALKSGEKDRISIWSSACSTGQESYSIAMVILEELKLHGCSELSSKFKVLGTDISTDCISRSRAGVYDTFSINRGLSERHQRQYFTLDGSTYKVNESLKDMLTFEVFNLVESFSSLAMFDLIFCRNVGIYFSKPVKRELYGKLSNKLSKNGVLILGSSEYPSFYTDALEEHHYQNNCYYTAKERLV